MQSTTLFPKLSTVLVIQCLCSGIFAALSLHIIMLLTQNTMGGSSVFSNHSANALFNSGFVIITSQLFLLTSPLIGYCSDCTGRKNWLRFAIASAGVGYILIAIAMYYNNLLMIILGMLCVSISNCDLPLISAMAVDVSQHHQRACYLVYIQAIIMTLPIVDIIFNFLFEKSFLINFYWILIILAAIAMGNLLFVYRYLPETNLHSRKKISIDTEAILSKVSQLFRSHKVILSFILLFIFYFMWGLYFEHLYTYLKSDFNLQETFINSFIILKCIVLALSALFIFPLLIKKFSLESILWTSFGLTSLTFFLQGIFHSMNIQWLSGVCLAFMIPYTIGLLWYTLVQASSPRQHGLLMACIAITWSIAWMSSDAVSSLLDHISVRVPVIICSTLGGSLFVIWLPLYLSRIKQPKGVQS